MSLIKPRTTTIPIYDGDDLEHMGELRMAADAAERRAAEAKRANRGAPLRLGDVPPNEDADAAQNAKDAYDAFVDESAERATGVVLHAIGRKRFRDLMAEHPPRKVTTTDDEGVTREADHDDDAPYSVNVESFADALLSFTDGEVRTIMEPEFGSTVERRAFLDNDLSDGDYERVWQSAYWLNRSPGSDPKASRFSAARPSSAVTST